MVEAITLIVLRCRDVSASKRFYEALGITFAAERHGAGPEHWSCRIGATVLELHPAGPPGPSVARIGFRVADVAYALRAATASGGRVDREHDAARDVGIVVDPDGTKVELAGPGADAVTESPGRWSVWRQDDNGQRFRISGGHSRVDAERACAEFEAKGHKQLYWIAPDEFADG